MLPSSLRNAGSREHNYGDKMSKCPLLLFALRLCGVEIFTFYFHRAGLKLGRKKTFLWMLEHDCWDLLIFRHERQALMLGDEVWPTVGFPIHPKCVQWGSGLVFVWVSQVLSQQSNISIQISLCAQEKRPFLSVYCEI